MIAVCAASPAHADHASKHDAAPTRWSVGVSKTRQKKATELFDAGNKLFEENKYTDALVEYEKAIQIWDNPNIEFNLAVCLLNIRQPLDAWDHLVLALRYGEEPLGKQSYEQALTYKVTLETSLAQLEVSNEQDDVQVMLDGREMFTGKAVKSVHLLPGKHQLVATRDGYETDSRALDLPPGKATHEAIELQPVRVEVKVKRENYERRWSWWIPWATISTGVGFALIGTGVYLQARSDIKAYDNALAGQCPMGCKPSDIPAPIAEQQQHAQRVSQVGIGFWTAGAAVAVAAGVMAVLNRPRLLEDHPEIAIAVTPTFTGASIALTFR
jgi:tetratricopeptide (TPR) repeat protein